MTPKRKQIYFAIAKATAIAKANAIAKAIVLGGPGIGNSANNHSSAAGEHENSQQGPNHVDEQHNLKMRHDYDHQLF